MDKVWSNRMSLKSTTYNFLYKFSYYIEENNGLKYFKDIIWQLIGFWNNDWYQLLEMRRLITEINI